MSDKLRLNMKGYQILTDSGFRPFAGIAEMGQNQSTLKFTFDDGSSIEVTPGHKFIYNIKVVDCDMVGVPVHAEALSVGDTVSAMDGELSITNIEDGETQTTYDLIEVGDHKYKTNSVISHNCEFLSSDPLLIDSMILNQLEAGIKQPIREDVGFKFYQQLQPNKTYLVGIDPATGSGADFSTILVYDFQDLTLVAQYRSNTVSSPHLYAHMKLLLNKISAVGSTTYFSIENNGVGEGMVALYENDENVPKNAEFVSEDGKDRLGMRTENRVKLRTCLTVKQMVESGVIDVRSELLHKEFKSFIVTRGNYAAQVGATDDLISALLIIVRLLEELATYEQRAFDVMNSYEKVGSFNRETATDDSYEEYDEEYIPDGFLI